MYKGFWFCFVYYNNWWYPLSFHVLIDLITYHLWRNVCLNLLPVLKIREFDFLLLSFKCSLCILDTRSLSGTYFVNDSTSLYGLSFSQILKKVYFVSVKECHRKRERQREVFSLPVHFPVATAAWPFS